MPGSGFGRYMERLMGNEWNNFAEALSNAGANIAQGFIVGSIRKDAQNTYKKSLKNIDKIISLSPSGQENQQPTDQPQQNSNELPSFFDGFNKDVSLTDNIGNMTPIGSEQMNTGPVVSPRVNQVNQNTTNPQDEMLKAFIDGVAKLNQYGEYGAGYVDPLKAFYESKLPKQVKTKTDVTNGYLIKYDEEGNILKKTKIDDLPKQEKNNVLKYSKMTLEEAELLQDNELTGDAFFYLPQDVQTALMQKYPALKQMNDEKFEEGDFSPKGPGGRKYRGSSKNSQKDIDSQGENDVEKTASNITDLMSIANTRELTLEEQTKLDELQSRVESSVRTMREKGKESGVNGFVNRVLKDWGRTDPGSIPPEEWAREILEEIWDDDEWNQIRAEFQKLTGSSLESYMK